MEGTWTVRCLCGAEGLNYDDGGRVFECVGCLTWMHTNCYGISDDMDPPGDMFCNNCLSKNNVNNNFRRLNYNNFR